MMMLLPSSLFTLFTVSIVRGEQHHQCIEGYTMNKTGYCVACDMGQYKYLEGNTECITCPDNSNTTNTGSIRCDCNNGYYRTVTENITVKCTTPPSAPELVYTLSLGGTNVHIKWSPPTDNGGRSDISYRVTYSNGSFMGPVVDVTDDSLSCNVTGLTPSTQYTISVTSFNGVSNQDTGDIRGRTVSITVNTDPAHRLNDPSTTQQSSTHNDDWHLLLAIIFPAIFLILLSLAIYTMIWVFHRHYYTNRHIKPMTPPAANAKGSGNKLTPPLPSHSATTTLSISPSAKLSDGNTVYYIDERDIVPASASDIMYEQVDSPTTVRPVTVSSDQGYLSIVSSGEVGLRGSQQQVQDRGIRRNGDHVTEACVGSSNGYPKIIQDAHTGHSHVVVSTPPVENVYEDIR